MSRTFRCSKCIAGSWRVSDPRLCPHSTLPSEPAKCGCGGDVLISLFDWQGNDPERVRRVLICKRTGGLVDPGTRFGGCKDDPASAEPVHVHSPAATPKEDPPMRTGVSRSHSHTLAEVVAAIADHEHRLTALEAPVVEPKIP